MVDGTMQFEENLNVELMEFVSYNQRLMNRIAKLKELLTKGADVNLTNKKGDSILHLSVVQQDVEMVKCLVKDLSADIYHLNSDGKTPIDLAVELNNEELLEVLFKPPISGVPANKYNKIRSQLIYSFMIHDSDSRNIILGCKNEETLKIIKITHLSSLKLALNFVESRDFQRYLNDSFHCFVVVLQIHDERINEANNDDDTLRQLHAIFETDKPLIIEIIYIGSKESLIFFKDYGNKKLQQFERQTKITKEEFCRNIAQSNIFDLPCLLQALYSEIGGRFVNNLLEIHIDTNQMFNGCRLIDYATKCENILCIRFLQLFNCNILIENENMQTTLDVAASYGSFRVVEALLDYPIIDSEKILLTERQKRFLKYTDKNDLNLLMIACEKGNLKFVKSAIVGGFNVNLRNKRNEYSSEIAYNFRRYEILLELLKAESHYPRNFDKFQLISNSESAGQLIMFINEVESLHSYISCYDMARIIEFIQRYPDMQHVYNVSNQSALTTALLSENYNIYAFLRSKGYSAGEDKKFDKILSFLMPNQKSRMRIAMQEYFRAPDNIHIIHLLARSRLGFSHTVAEKEIYFERIKYFFEELDSIPEISPILKIVAQADFVKIIFDFNSYSVVDIDPTTNASVRGIAYHKSGVIYVGAKDEANGMGTLAHEITHYALQILYGNDCKPYGEGSIERMRRFERINVLYGSGYQEALINLVYRYPLYQRHAELIVRVPHLLAFYRKDKIKLEEVQNEFEDLFRFFKEFVLLDIEKETSQVRVKSKIRTINRMLRVTEKQKKTKLELQSQAFMRDLFTRNQGIRCIISNLPQLTINSIYHHFDAKYRIDNVSHVESHLIFADGKNLANPELRKMIVDAINSDHDSKSLIVDFSSQNETEIDISGLKKNVTLIIDKKDLASIYKLRLKIISSDIKHVNHIWRDLMPESQEMILSKAIFYQDRNVILRDLVTMEMKESSTFLEDILTDNFKRIGTSCYDTKLFNEQTYVERSFTKRKVAKEIANPMTATPEVICLLQSNEPREDIPSSGTLYTSSLFLYTDEYISNERQSLIPNSQNSESNTLSNVNEYVSIRVDDNIKTDLKTFTYEEIEMDQLLAENINSEFVFISDGPGGGKSTTLMSVTMKLKNLYPCYWIALIDLKKFTKAYEINLLGKQNSEALLEYLSNYIFMLSDRTESVIFSNIFKTGKLILLLDGFDEISPYYKDFILSFMEAFRHTTNNQLWLTTRKHLVQEIEEKFNVLAYSLAPFSEQNQISLLMNFWRDQASGSAVNLRSIAKNFLSKVSQVLSSEFIGIPLQIQMLAEIYEDEILKDIPSINLYNFYDKFFERKWKIWERKSKSININDHFQFDSGLYSMFEVHRIIGLRTVFGDDMMRNLHIHLEIQDNESNEHLLRIGILAPGLKFLHATFAEFFAVNFLIKRLDKHPCHITIKNLIVRILSEKKNFEVMRMFLNNASSQENILPAMKKNLSEIVCDTAKKQNNFDMFHIIVQEGHLNIMKYLEELDETTFQKLLKSDTENTQNLIVSAVLNKNELVLKTIWELSKSKKITNDELKRLITESIKNKKNAFITAASRNKNKKVIKTLYELSKDIVGDAGLEEVLLDGFQSRAFMTVYKTNIMHIAATNSNSSTLQEVWNVVKKETVNSAAFLTAMDRNNRSPLYLSATRNKDIKVFKTMWDIEVESFGLENVKRKLLDKDSSGNTIFHYAAAHRSKQVFKFLWKFTKHLSNIEKQSIFEDFGENRNVLLLYTPKGSLFWMAITINKNKDLVRYLWQISVDIFGVRPLIDIVLNCDSNMNSIIHLASLCESEEMIVVLWRRIQRTFGELEQNYFLLYANKNSDTAFHLAARENMNKKVLIQLLNLATTFLSKDDLKLVLTNINQRQETVFDSVLYNKPSDCFERTIAVTNDILEKHERKDLIFKKTPDDRMTFRMNALESGLDNDKIVLMKKFARTNLSAHEYFAFRYEIGRVEYENAIFLSLWCTTFISVVIMVIYFILYDKSIVIFKKCHSNYIVGLWIVEVVINTHILFIFIELIIFKFIKKRALFIKRHWIFVYAITLRSQISLCFFDSNRSVTHNWLKCCTNSHLKYTALKRLQVCCCHHKNYCRIVFCMIAIVVLITVKYILIVLALIRMIEDGIFA